MAVTARIALGIISDTFRSLPVLLAWTTPLSQVEYWNRGGFQAVRPCRTKWLPIPGRPLFCQSHALRADLEQCGVRQDPDVFLSLRPPWLSHVVEKKQPSWCWPPAWCALSCPRILDRKTPCHRVTAGIQRRISRTLPASFLAWISYAAQGRTPPYIASRQHGWGNAGSLRREGWWLLHQLPNKPFQAYYCYASHGLCDSHREGQKGQTTVPKHYPRPQGSPSPVHGIRMHRWSRWTGARCSTPLSSSTACAGRSRSATVSRRHSGTSAGTCCSLPRGLVYWSIA